MGNVIPLGGVTKLDLDADRTLEGLKGDLSGFVIAGYDKDGNEFFSSTYADGGEVIWLLERMKLMLLRIGDKDQ